MKGLDALDSENPHLILPIGQFVGGLDIELNVPIGGSTWEDFRQITCFIAPDEPSFTGGWTFERGDATRDTHSGEMTSEDEVAAKPEHSSDSTTTIKLSGPGAGTGILCEVDFRALELNEDAHTRAEQLKFVAREYAEVIKQKQESHIDFYMFVDRETRDGIWMRFPQPTPSAAIRHWTSAKTAELPGTKATEVTADQYSRP
jgi:hypothetical protein